MINKALFKNIYYDVPSKSRKQRLITKECIVMKLMLYARILFHPHGMSTFITESLQIYS